MYAVTARASRLIRAGAGREAEELLAGVLRIEYFHPAWQMLDMLYGKERLIRERLVLAEFAWASDPWRPRVCLSLAESRLASGDGAGARETLGVCATLPMTDRERARFERLVSVTKMNDR